MRLRFIGFALLVNFSCQTRLKNRDVIQFRESLPKIETPIKFNSDMRVKYKAVELPDNSLVKKLNERSTFSLLGKIFETESNITILGYTFNEIGTPILITFDNTGKEISTHIIFETAKSEPGHHTSNLVTIFPDRRIVFTDSSITRKLNEKRTDEIFGTDSLILVRKNYFITDTGTIEMLK